MKEDSHNKEHNARKKARPNSGGPRTNAGKAISRWNALKHGILSKAVVLQDDGAGETQKEFDSLLKALQWELQPQGVVEEMLVEKIAVSHWRLRRVLCSEAGEFDLAFGNLEMRELQRGQIEHEADRYHQISHLTRRLCDRLDSDDHKELERGELAVRQRMRASVLGIRHLIDQLDSLKESFGEQDYLEQKELTVFVQYFGLELPFTQRLILANDKIRELRSTEPIEEQAVCDQRVSELKQKIATLIDFEKDKMIRICGLSVLIREQQLGAQQRAMALPDSKVLDRIIRYQTALEREFYRALQQLERMQRMRKGESVAPPASISLS
jgi:hypothetical protein